MIVAGVDIGLKNLAICICNLKSSKILHWQIYNITAETTKKLQTKTTCVNMINTLDQIYWEKHDVDNILIENQYKGRFNNVSQWMYCYFVIRGFNVSFVDAKRKFRNEYADFNHAFDLKNYTDRKKFAVAVAGNFLTQNKENQDPSILEYFQNCKKKDDLSDALMYCLIQAK